MTSSSRSIRGDSPYQLAPTPFTLANGTPTSLGVNTLAQRTCGTGANKTAEVMNGIANPFCSQTLVQSQVAPTRTTFPTEQLRFSSHYWDKVAFNGRLTYSGGVIERESLQRDLQRLLARTFIRQEIDTGGYANGRLAHNKRNNLNGDFGVEAELSKYFSVSDILQLSRLPDRGQRHPGLHDLGQAPPDHSSELISVNTPLDCFHSSHNDRLPVGIPSIRRSSGNTVLGIVTIVSGVQDSPEAGASIIGNIMDRRRRTSPGIRTACWSGAAIQPLASSGST